MKTLLLATALALSTVTALPAFAATDSAAASAPAAQPRAKMLFWFLDRNGDGVIDQNEITAYRTARFNALGGHDGVLTRDEVVAAWSTMRSTHHHRRPAQMGGAAQAQGASGDQANAARKERVAAWRQKRQEKMLERMGFKDGVNQITLAEFLKLPSPLFTRADPNGTGKITEAAFLAAFADGQAKWRQHAHKPGQNSDQGSTAQ